MASWQDQERRVATADECKARWNGAPNGERFRCALCGHRFKIGDGWRWVYGAGRTFIDENGSKFGVRNFMACDACDGPDVLDRWVERNAEFCSVRFWALR